MVIDRTWEQRLGRVLAGAGALAGVAYLVWRAAFSLAGVPGWLAWPALAVEVAGVAASIVLVWALWPRLPVVDEPTPLVTKDEPIDVVIRCSGQSASLVRATLLSTSGAGGRVLVDLADDAGLRELAAHHDARYVAVPGGDLDGLSEAAHHLERPFWLVVDAGDVVSPAAFDVLRTAMRDPRVAIAIAPAVDIERDRLGVASALREFDQRSLRPRLGERGVAVFSGTGALIRAAAVSGHVLGTASSAMVGAQLTTELLADGWRVVAPAGRPVIGSCRSSVAEDEELRDACAASAARWTVAGHHGALGRGRLQPNRRLGLVAQSIGPLSGVHRGLFVLVLLASLLNGTLPFRPDPVALLSTWAPWFVLTPLGLALLSGWTLRPGQRASSSMRLLGPSWRGVLTPNGRPDRPGLALAGAFGIRHGAALSGAVALVSIVLSLRGLSDRVTHTMQPMPHLETVGLLAVAVWTLAIGLHSLQLLHRPRRVRRTTRVSAAIPGSMLGRAALVVDLTPEGAAVVTDRHLPVGAACALEIALPTTNGVTVTLAGTVRHSGAEPGGGQRLGIEFVGVDPTVHEALVASCLVEPALAQLGDRRPETVGTEHPLDDLADAPRRIGLRAAALVAVSGALASATPPGSAQADSSALARPGSRVVAAGVRDASPVGWIVTAVCAVIAIGLVGGMRPARLRVAPRRVRPPSRRVR